MIIERTSPYTGKVQPRELYEEDVEYTANSLSDQAGYNSSNALPDEAWHAQAAQYVREENLYAELGLIKIEEEQNITDQYEVEDSGEPDWDNIAKRQEQQKWESDCNPLIGGE
jgi:hypothetical protein